MNAPRQERDHAVPCRSCRTRWTWNTAAVCAPCTPTDELDGGER